MAQVGRVYGGVSAAERHAGRRRQLLECGLDLLGDRAVADLTVGDVCARAGLSKRYFYEHFESMDAFVDAVMDDVVDRLAAAVFAERPLDAKDLPRDRLAAFVHAITSDPRLARIVFVESFGSGTLGRHRRRLVHDSVTLLLDDFLAPGRTAIEQPTTRTLVAYSLAGATGEVLVAWAEGDLDATPDELTEHLASLFERMASS